MTHLQHSKVLLVALALALFAACGGGDDGSPAPGDDADASTPTGGDAGGSDAPPGLPPAAPPLPDGVRQHAIGKIGSLDVDLTSPAGASDGQGSLIIDVSGGGVEFEFDTIDLLFQSVTGAAGFLDANQVLWTDSKCTGFVSPPEMDGVGQSGPYITGFVYGTLCNDQGLEQDVQLSVSFVRN